MAAVELDSNWEKASHSNVTYELTQYWNINGWIVQVTIYYNQNGAEGSSARAVLLNRQTFDESDLTISFHPTEWAHKVAALKSGEAPEGVLLAAATLVARMEKILSSL